MTINHHHIEQETWTVDEFQVNVRSINHHLSWGGIFDTYDKAREAGIGILVTHGVEAASQMEIRKITRLATKEEQEAAQELAAGEVQAAFVNEIVEVSTDIDQVTGISDVQRGVVAVGPSLLYSDGEWQYHIRQGMLIRYHNATGQSQVLTNDGAWRTYAGFALRQGDERKVVAD